MRRSLYDPTSTEPFKLSRSKIDLFLECPRCFWLDRVKGVKRPDMPGFALNIAVDELLKKEFDGYRSRQEPHPTMVKFGVDAVPFQHAELDAWRDSLHLGVQFLHLPTQLLVTGGVDDVWQDKRGELIVVDYKATSTVNQISLDDEYKAGYKRQAEVYQWLLRQNGFTVSPTAYFLFANGVKDRDVFDATLEFDLSLIPYKGDDTWVEPTLEKIKITLDSTSIPDPSDRCAYCPYRAKARAFE